jgi:predicted amino acid-binding ACT domain protein
MSEYIISITSRDRIGIVYEISTAISQLDGNIADSRQSVMCGYYTMILHTAFPESVSQRVIERKLAEVDAGSDTSINAVVKPMEMMPIGEPDPENNYVLTASGTDQIGLVATVAKFCVDHQINILDLSTTLSNGEFVMIFIVDLAHCGSIKELRLALTVFAEAKKLNVVLQHHDIFKAVNDINFPIRPIREA